MLSLSTLLLSAPLAVFAHGVHHLPRADSCTAVSDVHFTNYGYPDASGLTQYSCDGDQEVSGNVATPLGDGTAAKPYSAALSDTATAFKKCETVYIPYFQKYFKFVDICAQCRECNSFAVISPPFYSTITAYLNPYSFVSFPCAFFLSPYFTKSLLTSHHIRNTVAPANLFANRDRPGERYLAYRPVPHPIRLQHRPDLM